MKTFLTAFFILNLSICYSQPSFFYKEFGDSTHSNIGKSVYQIQSGSIFFCGYSNDTAGNNKIQFSKLDENGNLLFINNPSLNFQNAIMSKMVFVNNEFLICGQVSDSAGNLSPMIMKTDTNGILVWEKTYPNNIITSFSALCSSPSGNIYVAGSSPDSSTSLLNNSVLKTDNNGNIIWAKSYGDPAVFESSEACICISDNQVIIAGDKFIRPGVINGNVLSIDSSGTLVWERTLDNLQNSGCKDVMADSYGNIIISGEAATDSSFQFDIQLAKLNALSGDIMWLKYIRGSNESDAGFSIIETDDHNYILTGYGYDTSTFAKRVILTLTDSSGNQLSKSYFSNSAINIGFDIEKSVYGGYLIAGTNYSDDKHILIYNSPSANISVNELSLNDNFYLFPNPVKLNEFLKWNIPLSEYSVSDVTGKIIRQEFFCSLQYVPINLKSGLYFFRGEYSGKYLYRKFFVE